jgi:hypothetical protein
MPRLAMGYRAFWQASHSKRQKRNLTSIIFRGLIRDFHSAFSAMKVSRRLPLLRPFSAFPPVREPDTPSRAFARTKAHDLNHFEAITQTPLPQLPSAVLVDFPWLPRLPGRQRQSHYLPHYASKQAPRQVALQGKQCP